MKEYFRGAILGTVAMLAAIILTTVSALIVTL